MSYIAKTNDLVKIVTKSNNNEIFIGNISCLHDIVSLTNSSKNINNYDCTLFINEHPLHRAYGLAPYGCVGICVSDIESIEKIDYQKKKRVRSETIAKKKVLDRLERFKTQTELSETMVGEDLAALEYAIKAVKEYKVRKYN